MTGLAVAVAAALAALAGWVVVVFRALAPVADRNLAHLGDPE